MHKITMFLDRMTYLLIDYNKKAPWWRSVATGASEGSMIGFWIFMWLGPLILAFTILCFEPTNEVMIKCMNACISVLGISIIIAIWLGIRQRKGKIQDVPLSISDKTLKTILAIYIIVPVVFALFGFFVLLTHYYFGWFSFMD